MTTHTKFLGLIATSLAGVLFGLWLAAETWKPIPRTGVRASGGDGHDEDATADAPPLCRARPSPRGDWNPGPSVPPEDEAHVALEAVVKDVERTHARPRANETDESFTPRPNDVCLAATCENESGDTPAGARVAVFALDDGSPRLPALAQSPIERGGLAYLRASGATELIVVAYAPGRVPETRHVRSELGSRLELEPFVLQRGETIGGTVTAGGSPLARAQVEVEARATSLAVPLDGGPLGWRQGRFVWTRAEAETRADGTYEVGGLESGDHVLWIGTVRQREAAIDVSLIPRRHAIAPATDADFSMPGAWLELSFQSDQRPLCCVEVQIQAGDRQFMRTTDERGRIAMRIQPAVGYPVVAARSGYSTRRVELRGMVDGEHGAQTIELEPQKQLATLEIDDAGSAGVNEAVFRFHPRFAVPGEVDLERTVERDRATNRFLIQAVPSGPWYLTMTSGRRLIDAGAMARPGDVSFNANCDASAMINVPDSGSTRVSLSVTPRGSLSVTARTDSGTRVPVHCALFDLRGEPMESVTLGARVPDFQMPIQSSMNDLDAPTYVYSSLCGGTVDLVVTRDDCQPTRTTVSIVPGQVTPVNVVLRRR